MGRIAIAGGLIKTDHFSKWSPPLLLFPEMASETTVWLSLFFCGAVMFFWWVSWAFFPRKSARTISFPPGPILLRFSARGEEERRISPKKAQEEKKSCGNAKWNIHISGQSAENLCFSGIFKKRDSKLGKRGRRWRQRKCEKRVTKKEVFGKIRRRRRRRKRPPLRRRRRKKERERWRQRRKKRERKKTAIMGQTSLPSVWKGGFRQIGLCLWTKRIAIFLFLVKFWILSGLEKKFPLKKLFGDLIRFSADAACLHDIMLLGNVFSTLRKNSLASRVRI